MAERQSEFTKLLSEAPMAQDADTVTMVGSLARTKDAACFVLRTADGRSITLDVDAVKSARTIADAIGQSLVELVLDAKRVPEQLKSGPDYTVAQIDYQMPNLKAFIQDVGGRGGGYTHKEIIEGGYPTAGPSPEWLAAYGSYGTRTYLTAYDWTSDHHLVQKAGYDGAAAAAPFAAAMPHQSDPATRAFLASPFSGPRTYLTAYVWTGDHHAVQKAWSDPQN